MGKEDKIKWQYYAGADTYLEHPQITTFNNQYGYSRKELTTPKTIFDKWLSKYKLFQRLKYRMLIRKITRYYKPVKAFKENPKSEGWERFKKIQNKSNTNTGNG